MTVQLVDRHLPGITPDRLAAAQGAAIATTEQFRAAGREVRYLRSLFEAPDAEVVKAVNDTAQIPYTTVYEALELPQSA